MTNEEMQKAMEFIVEMEARSSAKIDTIAEAQKEAERRLAQSEGRWARTEGDVGRLLSQVRERHRS